MEGGDPGWFDQLSRDWLASLRRRGRSDATRRVYRWALETLDRHLTDQGIASGDGLTRHHLRTWQDSLLCHSPATQQLAGTAVRGLLRWAAREGALAPLLWDQVDGVRVPPGLPRPLSEPAIRSILGHLAKPTRDLARLRARALFLFLLTSGARISEALQLDRAQLRGDLIVRGKGGAEKRLRMSPLARTWIEQYLRARGRDGSPALWITLRPPAQRQRLGPEGAQEIWLRLARELGLPRWTNHQIRHSAGTVLFDAGASELEVAEVLGHRNLAMIRRYVQVREGRLDATIARLDELVPPEPRPPLLRPLNRRRRPPRKTA